MKATRYESVEHLQLTGADCRFQKVSAVTSDVLDTLRLSQNRKESDTVTCLWTVTSP